MTTRTSHWYLNLPRLIRRAWIVPGVATAFLALALVAAGSAQAQTADGVTPAVESICETWGMSGKALGLCNAYCEAMDCDAEVPMASPQACERVKSNIDKALDGKPFPECKDNDNDGIPNGLDRCPNVAMVTMTDHDGDNVADDDDNCPCTSNKNQEDTDGNDVGDVCDACPCFSQTEVDRLVSKCEDMGPPALDQAAVCLDSEDVSIRETVLLCASDGTIVGAAYTAAVFDHPNESIILCGVIDERPGGTTVKSTISSPSQAARCIEVLKSTQMWALNCNGN